MSVLFLLVGCLYTGENVTVLASVEEGLFVVEDALLCASAIEECVAAQELQVTLVPQDFRWGESGQLEAEVVYWAQNSEGLLTPAFTGGWNFELLGGESRSELVSAVEDDELPVVRLTLYYLP